MERTRRLVSTVMVMLILAILAAPSVSQITEAATPPRLIDLTITDRISGGGEVWMGVTLSKVATEDVRVPVSSSDESIIDVPAYITVTKGRRTGETTVSTAKVAKRTPVVLTAQLGDVVCTETVHVWPVTLDSISAPTSIVAGQSGQVTVRLTEPAPSTGVVVKIYGNRPSVMTVPSTVEILPSRQTARFTVTTKSVGTNAEVKITAKLSGSKDVFDTTMVLTTNTPTATSTATTVPPTATSTATDVATSTSTTVPTSTSTTVPTSTSTMVPTTTSTTEPTSTSTTVPTSTSTTVPTSTSTTVPTSTSTTAATSTSTAVPSSTATTVATATGTATSAWLIDFEILELPILGLTPGLVKVCLTEETPDLVVVDLYLDNELLAFLDVNQITLGGLFRCKTILVTSLLNGSVTLTADINGVTFTSPLIDIQLPLVPTNTPTSVAPTNTPVVVNPNITFSVIVQPILGITPALVNVCWADPVPSLVLAADVTSSNPSVATVDLDLTFSQITSCHQVAMVGLFAGDARLQVTINGTTYQSQVITWNPLFP